MDPKEQVISAAYYNVRTGYGSIAHTLKQAREVDPSIKREDVKRFLDRQEVRQRKRPKRYNSFIPNGRLDQIQIDLADFGARAPVRYAFVAIDSFTKEAAVVPIKTKTGESTGPALEQVLKLWGCLPQWFRMRAASSKPRRSKESSPTFLCSTSHFELRLFSWSG